jgi:hypothetical protein
MIHPSRGEDRSPDPQRGSSGIGSSVPASPRVKSTAASSQQALSFRRWFLLVYLPLTLLLAGAMLWLGGALPRWAMPFLVALTIWGAVASGLLIERLRRREATYFSGKAFGLLWLVFLGAIGALFAWVGLETSSTLGLMLMLAGLFLSLVAVFAFAFKLVDLAFRRISRGIRKRPR